MAIPTWRDVPGMLDRRAKSTWKAMHKACANREWSKCVAGEYYRPCTFKGCPLLAARAKGK